jgi:hypothetical protein
VNQFAGRNFGICASAGHPLTSARTTAESQCARGVAPGGTMWVASKLWEKSPRRVIGCYGGRSVNWTRRGS